jgi:CRISPR-associated protein Csx17
MSLHIHHLAGCSPTPLAHYLKALAVLRLISEQKDESARGWWQDESFFLATALDRDALVHFFLYEYAPSPIVAPWNGGSGFYPKDNQDAMLAIAMSNASRFSVYQKALLFAGKLVLHLDESPKKNEKETILQKFRSTCPENLLPWLDAALTLTAGGSPAYPAMLGTGGNDGRLDFTNNFMQHLNKVFQCRNNTGEPVTGAGQSLSGALFSQATNQLQRDKIGQFLPGSAGGSNMSTGFSGNSLINSWDFILMLEGAICFSAGLARRTGYEDIPQAAAPFAVRSSASGYASADPADNGARGEQWFPLWAHPLSLVNVRQMVTEGRACLGRKTSTRSVDFARAVARYGVSRGITSFQRIGYIERNGQANLAVPLGRWEVSSQPHQNLIDRISEWTDNLRRAGNGDRAPNSIKTAARTCEEAILACCRQGNIPSRWQDLLISLGMAEKSLLASPRFTADPKKRLKPLPPLDPEWLSAMDDNSVELRLAAALASQFGLTNVNGKIDWRDPIRRHFLPLSCDRQGTIYSNPGFSTGNNSLRRTPEVVAMGRDLLTDASAILNRRLLNTSNGLNLQGRYTVSLSDIAAFLSGTVNERKLLALAWPLTALRWQDKLPHFSKNKQVNQYGATGLMDLYGLLRLTHLPAGRCSADNSEYRVRCDPAIVQRILSGQPGRGIRLAAQRLQASGLRPHLNQAIVGRSEGVRLVASLIFPLWEKEYSRLVHRITRPEDYPAINQRETETA